MKIWQTLKRINAKSFWNLLVLAVKHPLFLYPTFIATTECMRISTLHYGREHYSNTPANAFRHALWNYNIALRCTNWNKNQNKVLKWTKAITDWHENAFVNRELSRAMDFHNNEVGRNLFVANKIIPLNEAVQLLKNMASTSKKIAYPTEIKRFPDSLVNLYETLDEAAQI